MTIFKSLTVMLFSLALVSCNLGTLEEKQAKKLDELTQKFKLSETEIDITKRTITGYQNELKTKILPSHDLHQAICYATSVPMPDRLQKAHYLYLEHYAEADEDYYVWFLDKGISEQDAEEMGNIYVKFHDNCKTTQGRLKNLKQLKNRP